MANWTDRVKKNKTNQQIMTVERQVFDNLKNSGLSHDEKQRRVNETLVKMGLIKR